MPAVGAAIAAAASTIGGAVGSFAGALSLGKVVSFGSSLLSFGLNRAAKRKAGAFNGSADRSSTGTVRDGSVARRLIFGETRVGGVIAYWTTLDGTNKLHAILAFGEGPIEAINEIYIGDDLAVDKNANVQSKYDGLIEVHKHLGAVDQPADANAVSNIPEWTENHKLLGVAYIYIILTNNSTAFPNGLNHVFEISANIKGLNTIYDPRTLSSGYTNNAALCIAHYLTKGRLGLNADYSTEIDETQLIAAADICDELVALRVGGTEANLTGANEEKRYCIDGIVYGDQPPTDVLADMSEAMAGDIVYANGKFQIIPGYYQVPTFELTASMVKGVIQDRVNKKPKRDRINTVKVRYIGEATNWQTGSAPTMRSDQYIFEDGEELVAEIDLPFTKSSATAQRIAKKFLEEARRMKSMTVSRCSIEALRAQAGRTIMFTFPKYGYDRKVFKVDEWAMTITDSKVSIQLPIRETDLEIYSWNSYLHEQLAGVPRDSDTTQSTGPFPVQNLSATSQGGAIALNWEKPAIPLVGIVVRYVSFRYRINAGTWSTAVQLPLSILERVIEGLDQDTVYEFELTTYTGTSSTDVNGITVGAATSNGQSKLFVSTGVSGAEVATPVFSPSSRLQNPTAFPLDVSITCATADAIIRYSTTEPPDTETDGTLYSSPVSMTSGQILYARAFKSGLIKSSIAVGDYVSNDSDFNTDFSSEFQ